VSFTPFFKTDFTTSFSFLFFLFFLFLLIAPLFFGLFISVTFAAYRLLGRFLFWRGLRVFIVILSRKESNGKNCKIIDVVNHLRTSQNYIVLLSETLGRLEFHNSVPKVYTDKMEDDS